MAQVEQIDSSWPRQSKQIWVFCLVALFAVQLLVSWNASVDFEHVGRKDVAYYYSIARRVATERGLTDNVRWHFLEGRPPLNRPAGDYWSAGWPAVLGAIMCVVGSNERSSILIMVVLSGFLPVLVAWVSSLCGLGSVLSLLAGGMLIFQGSVRANNVTPDVTLPYQLLSLLSLAVYLSLVQPRKVASWNLFVVGFAAMLPILIRTDGFVVFAAIVVHYLLARIKQGWRTSGWLLLGGGSCFAIPTLYNLVSFGSLSAPGARYAVWMSHYSDLYTYGVSPSVESWMSLGARAHITTRLDSVVSSLQVMFRDLPFGLTAVPVLGLLVGLAWRSSSMLLMYLSIAMFILIPSMVAPVVANPRRALFSAVPILCIVVVGALSDLGRLTKYHHLRQKLPNPKVKGVLVVALACAGMWLFSQVYLSATGAWSKRKDWIFKRLPAHLVRAQELRLDKDAVVMAKNPFQAAAVLDVATVRMPVNGHAAAIRAADFYSVTHIAVESQSGLARRLRRQAAIELFEADGVGWFLLPRAGGKQED